MSHSVTIKDVNTGFSQASGEHYLNVEVEVHDGEEFVDVRKFAFDLETPQEKIVMFLRKLKKTLDSDKKVGEDSAKYEKQFANAKDIKSKLTDTKI